MKKFCYGSALGLFTLTVLAAGASAQQDAPKWAPNIDLEAKLGSKRSLGEIDLFLPVDQDSRTLVFASVRTRADDKNSIEGNLGLGIRQMQDSGWNLGAYAYLDRRQTSNNNYFNQATLGVEALGRDFDARSNVYLPVGHRVRDLPDNSTASLSGASVQVSTDMREERALSGFDLEAGWRTPLFDSEDTRQLRLYAGGYYFSDSYITVQGPRLRAEVAFDQMPDLGKGRLYLGAETQHDSARGTQTFFSIRLRIPFGNEGTHTRQLTAQERRMTAPVVRDVDIVAQSRVVSTINETATATASGQNLTVLDSTTTTGGALPGAVAGAGANSTVILSGTFNTTAATTLQTGQTLMGAGSLQVRTASGRTATLTTPTATINGSNVGGSNGTIMMVANSTLRGMTITDTETNGAANSLAVYSNGGGSNITIVNSTITSNAAPATGATSHAITLTGGNNHLVSGNTLTANGGGGPTLALQFSNAGGVASNNYLSASGGNNNWYFRHNTATMQAGSTGNTVGSGTCFVTGGGSGSVSFTNAPNCN